MFTREEALAVWDDLVADKDAFLARCGELVGPYQTEEFVCPFTPERA